MNEVLPAGAAWWRAYTLAERVRPCRIAALRQPPAAHLLPTVERRMREWRSQSPFQQDSWFAARLAHDGLDEEAFRFLLAEPDDSLKCRLPDPPSWAGRWQAALGSRDPESQYDRIPLVGPLISAAARRLGAEAARLAADDPSLPWQPGPIVAQLISDIVARADQRLCRAVVLEMRIAGLQDRLPATLPSSRFDYFMSELRKSDVTVSFLQEYPVLARYLVDAIDAWTSAAGYLLRRWAADWPALCARFWPDRDPRPLDWIDTGTGDQHGNGQSVCILHFVSGEAVVYKPRPLAIDRHFSQLIAWLQERGFIDLRIPRILDRGDYGWAEFVAPAACTDGVAACRFFRREGALLALFYLLNANDFHRENLVAAGEYPVPVDLETLCGPDYGQFDEGSYDSCAALDLANSVVTTMLLPYFQEGEGGRVVELSGLGGAEGQLSLNPAPVWEGLGTDDVRLAFERATMAATPNRPTLDGALLSAFDFADEITAGFAESYQLLASHRRELLAESGPLARLRDDHVRVVLRATELYNLILENSFHPDNLRDAIDRERILDRLWFGADRTAYNSVATRILNSEKHDLAHGDIPLFVTRVGSRDLDAGDGTRLEGIFRRSGYEVSSARLEQFCASDLERQTSYIRSSLAALALNKTVLFQRYPPPLEVRPLSRQRLLAQASAIGTRVLDLAHWQRGTASWTGLACGETPGWHLRALGSDLYSGLPGIILFLAYLEALTGRGDFGVGARGGLATLRAQMAHRRSGFEFAGGFDGWGGLLYLWLHLSHLWHEQDLLTEACGMVRTIADLSVAGTRLDVVQGIAGTIVPLLSLHETAGLQGALDLACQLGDRLLRLAKPCAGGLAWVDAEATLGGPQTGFSHGASGIAWALSELYAVTSASGYADAALAAAAFERSHYSPEIGNWADLRPSQSGTYMAAWCHGASGIGLSRSRMLVHLDEPAIREDLRAATATTDRDGFGSNHSLCHGDLGNLELLFQASHLLEDGAWHSRFEQRSAVTLASIEERGCRCGTPLDIETPGLMDGLAGIGYGLLRLASPERVPAVLILEGPHAASPPAYPYTLPTAMEA